MENRLSQRNSENRSPLEPVPILLKKKKRKQSVAQQQQQQQQEATAEAAARTHIDIDMSHSTPEQPTFGEHDESDALPSDAIAATELDDLRDRRVYAARLGCVLHIYPPHRCYCRDDQYILHGPTRQGPVERVGKRSRVLPSRPHMVQHEPLRFVQRKFRAVEAQGRREVP